MWQCFEAGLDSFKAWCEREYSAEGAKVVYQHYLDKRVYPDAYLEALSRYEV